MRGRPPKQPETKKQRVNCTIDKDNYNFAKEYYINLSAVLNEKLSKMRKKAVEN